MKRFVFAVMTLMFAAAADAQVTLRVEGEVKRTPVAVVPFGFEGQSGSAPLDVAEVIGADLYRSGRFDPIPENEMLEKPTTGGEITFQSWRRTAVEAVVVGRIRQQGANAYEVEFQLYDPVRQTRLFGYRMPASRGTMRRVAHRAADMIYKELTGIAGVFATRVVYVGARKQGDDSIYRLVVADYDGENEYVMLESRDPIMSPAWSPDGRRVAYVSFEGNRSSIWVQQVRTGNRIQVSAEPGINGAPSFSPDGRKLVITLGGVDGNLDLYTLDLSTRETRRLTTHRAIDTEGSWSPDGRYIYFTSDRAGGPQVYRIPSAGGTPERVTFEGSYNARPRISPDGKKLAVIHNVGGNFRIGVYDLGSNYLSILSKGAQDESPSFAPNSDILVYATRANGGRGVLETVSADGLIRQPHDTGQDDVREPVWSPFEKF